MIFSRTFSRKQIRFALLSSLFSFSSLANADFFEWTNTEIQYLHGDSYRMPANPRSISQSIITFTHADGWKFGRNFMFMDTLITEDGQPSQTSVYGEAYSYFSAGKILGKDLSFSIFKDINATIGVNAGENFDSPKSGTRIALYGFTVDFNLPGFKLFSVDVLRHQILEPSLTVQNSSWQFTPVWKLPFSISDTKWSLEGFTDFIGSKGGNYHYNILAQPQLRLDVGDLWGDSNHLFVGVEYQYFYNKYGIKGLSESLPQALILWKF